MFKKIMRFIKSKKTGVICIGGNVKDSFIVNKTTQSQEITIVNKTTQNQEITINGKTYKGTHIIVNNLGIFVDGVKQEP